MRARAILRVVGLAGVVAGVAAPAAGQSKLMITDSGTGDRVMLFSAVDGSLIDANWITDVGAVGWSFTTPKEAITVNDEIWVSDQVTDAIHRFDKATRAYLSSITMAFGGLPLDNLRGMGFDGTTVYLVQGISGAGRVAAMFDTSGAPLRTFPLSGSSFDIQPFGADLLISSSGSNNIERWSTSGTFLDNFATGVTFPQQVFRADDGSIITVSTIATPPVEGVYHFNADGTLRTFIDTEPLKGSFGEHVPHGAYQLQNGNYLIASSTGVYVASLIVGGGWMFDRVLEGVDAQYIAPLIEGAPPCYANCDGSTSQPILNVNDFICFQTKYAAADPAANCDGSTTPPVLNVNDFICFQSAYAAGCP